MKRIVAWLERQTVHRKLLLVIVTTCCASLLAAGAALFIFMTLAVRSNFAEDVHSLTHIAAINCAAAVAFEDEAAATEILSTLQTQKHIIGAAILLPDGQIFASAGRTIEQTKLREATENGQWIENNAFLLRQPITADGSAIGFLRLAADFTPTHDRLFHSYISVFVFVFLGAIGIGVLLTSKVRRTISDPIRTLANTMHAAAQSHDPAAPTGEVSGGEMAQIAAAFNVMQVRIEASLELEQEIATRRRTEEALRNSEAQFRSLFENAPVGLYRSSREGRFTMANPTLLCMLGYETFTELEAVDIQAQICVLPELRTSFRECLEHMGMVDETEVQWRRRDGRIICVRESAKAIRSDSGELLYSEGCVEDITARKEGQAELQRLHRELVDASRQAGMAEVATGVLHNVGNVLNSVNVSATVLHEQVGRSKLASLQQAIALLHENLPQLGSFLVNDAKGKLLPGFLIKVTEHVAAEHQRWHEELRQMRSNVEHMKVIVSMQQSYAKVSAATEPLSAEELVEDALNINQAGLQKHNVQINRNYSDVPPVMVDKHKALQILVNLIGNAKHALQDGLAADKNLELKIYKNGSGRVKIVVKDNGIGIEPANMTRIFSHGFTTRRDGHGFGLHSGALAAKELGGILEAHSDGPGLGAAFTLELPIAGATN